MDYSGGLYNLPLTIVEFRYLLKLIHPQTYGVKCNIEGKMGWSAILTNHKSGFCILP